MLKPPLKKNRKLEDVVKMTEKKLSQSDGKKRRKPETFVEINLKK